MPVPVPVPLSLSGEDRRGAEAMAAAKAMAKVDAVEARCAVLEDALSEAEVQGGAALVVELQDHVAALQAELAHLERAHASAARGLALARSRQTEPNDQPLDGAAAE